MSEPITFTCSFDVTLGAYSIGEGESLKAVSNGHGKYYLYASWADGTLGLYTAQQINDLAGFQVVQ